MREREREKEREREREREKEIRLKKRTDENEIPSNLTADVPERNPN